MKPGATQIAIRLALVAVASVAVSAGLTEFVTASLARFGLFPSDAVLAGTLIAILALPALIVWGLVARRVIVFASVSLLGALAMSKFAEFV